MRKLNRERKRNGEEFVDSDPESSEAETSDTDDERPLTEPEDPAEAVMAGLRRSDNVPSHLFFSLCFESSKSRFLFLQDFSFEIVAILVDKQPRKQHR